MERRVFYYFVVNNLHDSAVNNLATAKAGLKAWSFSSLSRKTLRKSPLHAPWQIVIAATLVLRESKPGKSGDIDGFVSEMEQFTVVTT